MVTHFYCHIGNHYIPSYTSLGGLAISITQLNYFMSIILPRLIIFLPINTLFFNMFSVDLFYRTGKIHRSSFVTN